MLVLIAGVSGKLGTYLAHAAFSHGFDVRGLGRDANSVDATIKPKLESFVTSTTYYDVPALDRAVTGVNAVVCAYAPVAELDLDAHLLLLRAAERAGVTIFHASSWNADWRELAWGEFEHYDPHKAFQRHVELTSAIKPVYVFTGLFGDYLTSPYGPFGMTRGTDSTVTIRHWGDGTHKLAWTPMKDAADFSIGLLANNEDVRSGRGGSFVIAAGETDARGLADAYERVRGVKVKMEVLGNVAELNQQVERNRHELGPRRYPEYLALLLPWLMSRNRTALPSAEAPGIGRSKEPLVQWLRDNPEL